MISREFTIFSGKKNIVEATPVMCAFSVTVLTNLTGQNVNMRVTSPHNNHTHVSGGAS